MMNLINYIKSVFSQLLFPAICPLCQSERVDSVPICHHCHGNIFALPKPMLQKIQEEVQAGEGSPVFVGFLFNSDMQKMLHLLKYKNMADIGVFLGKELGKRMKIEDIGDFDVIIAVPIHKTRERERGYNQSGLIARGLSESLSIPCLNNSILRIKYTRSQTKLSREERRENIKDSFTIKNELSVKGKSIVLVDDVITTGATCNACASELIKSGAGFILKVAVATPTL